MQNQDDILNQKYISSTDASLVYGCSKDYISRLCREGKLVGYLLGRNWFIEMGSFQKFLSEKDAIKAEALQKLSEQRKHEYLEAQSKIETEQKSEVVVESFDKTISEPTAIEPVLGVALPQYTAPVRVAPAQFSKQIKSKHNFLQAVAAGVLSVSLVFGGYSVTRSGYPSQAVAEIKSLAHGAQMLLSGEQTFVVGAPVASSMSYLAASLSGLTNPSSDFFGKTPSTSESLFARAFSRLSKSFSKTDGVTPVTKSVSDFILAPLPEAPVYARSIASVSNTPIKAPLSQNLSTSYAPAPQPVYVTKIETVPGISQSYVDTQIQILKNSLSSEIFKFTSTQYPNAPGISQSTANLAIASRIDRLKNATLESSTFNNGTISGATLTGGSISGASISATSLSVSGSTSFEGGVTISPGTLTMPYFTANSTATSSTISYRLGIGTSTPTNTLAVHGTSYVSDTAFFGGAITATSTLTVGGATTLSSTLGVSGLSTFAGLLSTASSTIGDGTRAGGLTIYGGATTTGTGYFAGLVGIGTTSPSTDLSIHGNLYTSGTAFFGGAITATSTLTVGGATTLSSTLGVSGLSTFAGLLSTASSTIGAGGQTTGLTISGGATTTGNSYVAGSLGIGTTSPSGAFGVQGDGLVSGTFTAGSIIATSSFTLGGVGGSGGFAAYASSTIGAGTQTTGLTISGGATTTGNAYVVGGFGVGIATSTAGVFQTSGNAYIGGNLTVIGNSTTLGNSSSNTLTINSSITSSIVPNQNITYDLGSPSFYWRNAYVGTLNANNISAASTTIAGTASATFTLNSDNATSDTEDQDLIFFRGNVVPNALLSWKSSTDRFELNQPTFIQNASTDNLSGITLDLKGLAGQTGNLFRVASSTGTSLLNITSAGLIGIGSTTPTTNLSIQGNQYTSGTAFFGGAITATSTLSVAGVSTLTGGLTAFASSTIGGGTQTTGLTISGGATTTGNAYFAGRLGIGNTSPSYELDVTGTVRATTQAITPYITVASSGANRTNITLTSNGSQYGTIQTENTTGGGAWSLGYQSSPGSTIGTSVLTWGGSGFVGIGSTTPTTNLSVQGNQYTSGTAFFGGAITATSTLSVAGVSTLTGGLTAFASSTIGGGTQTTGLTISGGATTTGNAYFGGAITAASTLTLSSLATPAGTFLAVNASGQIIATSTPGGFSYLFPSNATSTLLAFNGGLTSFASTTIGGGTQITGLTINGGATTTGNAYTAGSHTFAGSTSIGTDGKFNLQGNTQLGAGSSGVLTIQNISSGTSVQLDASTASFLTVDNAAGGYGVQSGGIFRWSTDTALSRVSAGVVGFGTGAPGSLAGGLMALASSTIGAGGQATGLTISGGATTTGNAYFGGSVGIGTTTSGYTLGVAGNIGVNGYVNFPIASVAPSGQGIYNSAGTTLTFLGGSTGINFNNNANNVTNLAILDGGNVGVGTTSPFRKFSITDAVATAQMTVAYDSTRYTDFLTSSVGDLTITPQGQDIYSADSNLWICTGGSCPSGTPTGTGNIIVENKIGIGTTTPAYLLTVNSSNGTDNLFQIATTTNQSVFVVNATGRVGVGTSTPTQQFSVADRLFVGAGGASGMGTATSTFQGDIKITGKLDVGTIDPVYTIDGVKYATYGHSTIGIKEETVAVIEVANLNHKTGKYEKKISFKDLEEGSDLWLFYQVTDFGRDWKNLVINLTASFDGSVFYKKVPNEAAVIISASEAGEVSARFIANRFDSDKWPNLRPDQDDDMYKGHEIETINGGQGKPVSTNPKEQELNSVRF